MNCIEYPSRSLERDSSWCSTIDANVDGSSSNKDGWTNGRGRRVTFDERSNVYYENQSMYKEDCQTLWHSFEEYEEFRENTLFLIETIVDFEASIADDQDSENSYTAVLQNIYSQCHEEQPESDSDSASATTGALTRQQEEQFSTIYASHFNFLRIGLERHTVSCIKRGIKARRTVLSGLAKEVQTKCMGWSADDTAETLRVICEDVSRPARLFAMHLARAQHSSCIQ